LPEIELARPKTASVLFRNGGVPLTSIQSFSRVEGRLRLGGAKTAYHFLARIGNGRGHYAFAQAVRSREEKRWKEGREKKGNDGATCFEKKKIHRIRRAEKFTADCCNRWIRNLTTQLRAEKLSNKIGQ